MSETDRLMADDMMKPFEAAVVQLAPMQDRRSAREIHSLKKRVEELEAENHRLRTALWRCCSQDECPDDCEWQDICQPSHEECGLVDKCPDNPLCSHGCSHYQNCYEGDRANE